MRFYCEDWLVVFVPLAGPMHDILWCETNHTSPTPVTICSYPIKERLCDSIVRIGLPY
jgi:hypothetical protein